MSNTKRKRDGQMSWIREPWLSVNCKSSGLMVNLLVCLLLIGVSFRLLFLNSRSDQVVLETSSVSINGNYIQDSPCSNDTSAPNPSSPPPNPSPFKESPTLNDDSTPTPNPTCNLFNGSWVRNPLGPAYTNASCQFIEDHQNCLMNGRPDTEYLYWRWQPYQCELPLFDPYRFLDKMRNKSWALVGDSILRNQVQSFLCILSKVEKPIELYHSPDFRSRKWHFKNHNLTVSLIWTPFLVNAKIFENENGISRSAIQLHLDALDQSWTTTYPSFDFVLFSGGQWFLKNAIYYLNGEVTGCHNCPNNNYTELGYEFSYRKTLNLVFKYILDNFNNNNNNKVVIFRTWTPSHFENGAWFNGGTCKRKMPYKINEFNENNLDHKMREIELDEFNKAKKIMQGKFNNSDNLKLLDTYELSLLRPDGHAGAYRKFHPFERGQSENVQFDCLHWCVPGVVDTWNDIVMQMVVN